MTQSTEEKKIAIRWNVELFKWYFYNKKKIDLDKEKENLYNLMCYAATEDIYIFMRFFLYVSNTRKTDLQEVLHKIMAHFLGVTWPDFVMVNLHLIISLGKKDDVLYFLQIPHMSSKVRTWIEHQSKTDKDYKRMLEKGKLIKKKTSRKVKYVPDLKNDQVWIAFLMDLIEDPIYNGIVAGDLDPDNVPGSEENNIHISNVTED